MRYILEALAHDSMFGREVGTIQEKKSAELISSYFKEIGLMPIRKKKFIYPFSYLLDNEKKVNSAGNVLGKIETKSKKCILVSAHYDHIGRGERHSNDPYAKKIHNGADDNASGVAMMLQLAKNLIIHTPPLKTDIVFVAFSGEEDGLFGSVEFLRRNLISPQNIIANINLDMVGRLDILNPLLTVESDFEKYNWRQCLPSDTSAAFIVRRQPPVLKSSADHCSFLDVGVPALLISTGMSSDYHRPSDDVSKINFKGMEAILEYLQQMVFNLCNHTTDLRLLAD